MFISQHQLAMETNPLVEAGIFNNWPLAEQLICFHRFTPNTPESPLPIISFIKHKNTHAIEQLVTKYGANIDLSDPQLGTPMTYAYKNKLFEIFALLHRLGGDLGAPDCFGMTPNYLAVINKKSRELDKRLDRDEIVRLSDLHLPTPPMMQKPTRKRKPIQKSKSTTQLPALELPQIEITFATEQEHVELHRVTGKPKSKSCPKLAAHAENLNSRLDQLELSEEGYAFPTCLEMSEDELPQL